MTTQAGEVRLEVDKIGLGWYKIRATTDKGKIGLAWVYADNVNDKLTPPTIKKDKEPNEAGWYNIATSPVTITITGTGTIKYRLVSGLTQTGTDDGYLAEEGTEYTTPFSLNETGLITIYAWTTDGTYRSEYAIEKIRIDKNKPSINEPEISQANGKTPVVAGGKNWYTSNVEIGISGSDQTSEPIHYEYKFPGKNEKWTSKEMGEKIPVTDEGDTRVAIRTIDTAGNPSDERNITISIDRIAPTFTTSNININQENVKATSVSFSVNATDEGSGKTGGITYSGEITPLGGSPRQITSENGTFNITGLTKQVTYTITIKAKDPAGNESTAINGEFKTKGELKVPNLTIVAKNSSQNGNNGWVKGPVTISISDSAASDVTAAEYIYYEITNTKTGASAKKGGPIAVPSTSFDFDTDGEYQITAWVQDGNQTSSNKSDNKTESFKIDAGTPLPANITVSSTNAGPATNASAKQYYYNTRATVTIKAGTDITSGVYGVRYEVTGAQTKAASNYPYSSSGTSIDITTQGDSVIRAWTVDNAGNLSQTATEITIHLDNTVPIAPSLSITTTHSAYSTDSDPWFNNSTVNVAVTRGNDQGSYQTGGYQIKYGTRTAGSTTTPTLTTTTGSSVNVSVSTEGKTEVVAYTVDKAGNISTAGTKVVQIDRTAPTVSSWSATGASGTSITIKATATDTASGIYMYYYFVDSTTTYKQSSKSSSYTAIGLTHGSHVVGIIVQDKAGNQSTLLTKTGSTSDWVTYYRWKQYTVCTKCGWYLECTDLHNGAFSSHGNRCYNVYKNRPIQDSTNHCFRNNGGHGYIYSNFGYQGNNLSTPFYYIDEDYGRSYSYVTAYGRKVSGVGHVGTGYRYYYYNYDSPCNTKRYLLGLTAPYV